MSGGRRDSAGLSTTDRPEETAEAIREGWFSTGDLARKDEDGFFHIVDRKKELIIRGDYNVYPARSRRSSTSTRPCWRSL